MILSSEEERHRDEDCSEIWLGEMKDVTTNNDTGQNANIMKIEMNQEEFKLNHEKAMMVEEEERIDKQSQESTNFKDCWTAGMLCLGWLGVF